MLHTKLTQWNSYRILVTKKSWELPSEDFKNNTEARTMNELRSEMYHKLKTKSHRNLPPTSQGMEPHIYRSFYSTHCIINSIQIIEGTCQMLNRLEWGFFWMKTILCQLTIGNVLRKTWLLYLIVRNVPDQPAHAELLQNHVPLSANAYQMKAKILITYLRVRM